MVEFTFDEEISFYLSVLDKYNLFEIQPIIAEMGCKIENLAGETYDDVLREFIFWARRRGRTDEFLKRLLIIKSNFTINYQPYHFEQTSPVVSLKYDELIEVIASNLSVSELKQLSFFAKIDFENLPHRLLPDNKTTLSQKDLLNLRGWGIKGERLSIIEIQYLLKKEWVHYFLKVNARLRGKNPQEKAFQKAIYLQPITDILVYMKPNLFTS